MSMKVKDLKAYLDNLPKEYDDCEVICQKDAEGNGYSPLSGVDDECIYIPDSTWSGEVMDARWTADEACMDEEEWKVMKGYSPRCIVLCPTN